MNRDDNDKLDLNDNRIKSLFQKARSVTLGSEAKAGGLKRLREMMAKGTPAEPRKKLP